MNWPCNICGKSVLPRDYVSVPAHVDCVAGLPRKGGGPRVQGGSSYLVHCSECGKSDTESPRRERGRGGLRATCIACEKARRESQAKIL